MSIDCDVTVFRKVFFFSILSFYLFVFCGFLLNTDSKQNNFNIISKNTKSQSFNLNLPLTFSLDENFHIPNGFRKGGLCIAVISTNRTNYLIEVLETLFKYIQKYEPNLNYNLVWVDTASFHQGQLNIELSRRFHFDRKIFLSSPTDNRQVEGISTSNQLALSLCSKNDFFMPLEDDWKLHPNARIGFLQKTIELLNASPHQLYGIVYKETEPRSKDEKTIVVKVGEESFKVYYGLDRGAFSYTNGAAIYRMANIKEFYKDGVEHNNMFEICLSRVVNKLGHFFGFVDLIDNCTKGPGNCYGVFQHIGKVSTWR
ncbi:hypothetical protein M9Y10_030768 [Tritrichomonas musculus]|uniref:Glycosyltransferase 2-like domain-containing protein n=1 Tax=Tritrichomonas musculus TaxID=1915356 RepID=A0ABR2H2X2_9EUKA